MFLSMFISAQQLVLMCWDNEKGVFISPEDDLLKKTCNGRMYGYMERATHLTLKSTCMHHRHGCVIVKDGEIVAEGYNQTYTRFHHKFSIHAEVHAISKLKHNRRIMPQCEMYVVRIGPDRTKPLKHSRPCQDCCKAIEKAGIKRVYYSSNTEIAQVDLTS